MSERGKVWGQNFPLLQVGVVAMYLTRLQLMKSCTTSTDETLLPITSGGRISSLIRASAGDYVSSPTPVARLVLTRLVVGQQLCLRENRYNLFQGPPGNAAEHRHRGARVLFF